MNTTATTLAPPRLDLRSRLVSAPFALTLMVALGALALFLGALPRASVTYLPDEYLYSQLARSLGSGEGSTVLGQSVSLPAMLEPLVTAAFWGSTDAETAIRLSQALHSLLMALAAVPVYLIGRQLRLRERTALVASLVSLLAPGLAYASYVTADAVGYLLALVGVHAALRALNRPTAMSQAWFLVAAGLATFARLQYAALVPAFVVAALVVERGRLVQTARHFWLVATGVGVAALLAIIAGSGALGRYNAVTDFGLSLHTVDWTLRTTAFLLVATSAALSPPALAWGMSRLGQTSDRARSSFAALSLALIGALVVASAMVSADTHSDRFLERYLLIATPLVVLGFFCWLDDGRPARVVVIAAAAAVIIAAARVPVAGDLIGQGSADSPTLHAISRLSGIIGLVEASLAAALVATALAVLALAAAFSKRVPGSLLVGSSIACLLLLSVGAHWADNRSSDRAFANAFARTSTWVDDERPGATLLVQSPESNPYIAMVTTVFNRSIERAESLGKKYILPLDGLGKSPVSFGKDGVLNERDGTPVRGSVLFATGGSAFVFEPEDRVTNDKYYALVTPADGETRVRAFAAGMRSNNSVGPIGWVTAYPGKGGACTRATMRLTLPAGIPPTLLEFRDEAGKRREVEVRAGRFTLVNVDSSATASATLHFTATRIGDQQSRVGAGVASTTLVANVATGHLFAEPIECTV